MYLPRCKHAYLFYEWALQTMIDFLKEHVPEALVDQIEDEEPGGLDGEARHGDGDIKAEL